MFNFKRANHTKRLEDQVQERATALEKQYELMSLVNDTAALLLESDMTNHLDVMTQCMEMIGRFVDVDRVSVWKNKRKEDRRLYYRLVCQWANDGLPELDRETDFAYEEIMPSWESTFNRGESINCTIDDLPEPEHTQLTAFSLLSLLAVPIFLHGELWGFVSYDDYHNKRIFPKGEAYVLRSWGLLAVGAIQRNEIAADMMRTLTKLEAVTGNYKGIIWSVDSEGVITTFNGRYLEKIGLKSTHFEGKNIERAHLMGRHTDIIEHIAKTFNEGPQEWIGDVDGSVFQHFTTPMYDGEGRLMGAVGSTDDVTDRIKLQRDLEQAVKSAEAANNAKSAFLANMSHEIRTPMNAILGITDIQLLDETLKPETREAFGKIYSSGDLLLGIINDILDLSKIEAGKMELMNANYEIASLISDVAQLNVMRIGSKPIIFEMEIDENTPSVLIGDELRVKQILNNLLSNAFKYTTEGSVTLSVSAETVAAGDSGSGAGYPDKSNVVLSFQVTDTGQGMTKEQVDQLFDDYTRFNLEANRSTEGTGLGMSITRNLVQMMKGEIHVDSTPGSGSVFSVRIRQDRAGGGVLGKEIVQNLKQFRESSGAQMKRVQITRDPMPYGSVLIVDDVETNIYVALGLLAPYGLKVDSADSGMKTIEKIREGNVYDIIFMDHMMPEMDGMEATRILRGMGYEHPIVALTADAVVGQSEMFLTNGFDDFISKPIDIRQLNVVLNKLIRDKHSPEAIEKARRKNVGGAGQPFGDVGQTPAYTSAQKGFSPAPQTAAGAQAERSGAQAGSPGATAQPPQTPPSPGASAPPPAISRRFADAFVRDANKSIAALEAIQESKGAYSEEEIKTYIIHVHGMKSALANIGEKDLSAAALKLEIAGRAADTGVMEADTREFIDALRLVAEKLAPEKENGSGTLSQEEAALLREQLGAIRTAFTDYDKKAARDLLNGLREKEWPPDVRELMDAIAVHQLHSEFEEGVKTIDGFQFPSG